MRSDLKYLLDEARKNASKTKPMPNVLNLACFVSEDGEIIIVPGHLIPLLKEMEERGFKTWAYRIVHSINPGTSYEACGEALNILLRK